MLMINFDICSHLIIKYFHLYHQGRQ